MGFPRRRERAAQSAVWAEPRRLSDAQCGEKPPRSIGGRLRDNGRRYINRFTPFKLSPSPSPLPSPSPQACAIDYVAPSGSRALGSIRPAAAPSIASRRFTMGDLPLKFPSLHDSNQSPERDAAAPAYESHTEFRATNVTGILRHSAFVERQPARSGPDSLFSLDLERPVKKPRQWLDRMKGYTAKGWERISSPVPETSASSGVGDLIGVGSQYDSANKSATPASQANRDEPNRQDAQFAINANVGGYQPDPTTVPLPYDHLIDTPPQSDYSTRRLSNDTALRSASLAESIFTRPSSIVSTATSWDSTVRLSNYARGGLLWKRNASVSSILSTNRTSPGPRPDIDLDENPVPPVPLAVTAWPPRSIDSWVSCLDHSVSDQVTAAGRVAQQRRAKKGRLSEIFQEDVQDEADCKKDPSRLQPDPFADDNPDTTREPALSIISEGNSDGGCSNSEAVPMPYQTLVDNAGNKFLSIPRRPSTRDKRSCSATDTMTELTSTESRQPNLTPATSVADDPEGHDMSEDDESISILTDETDESFYEAFAATSLDSSLLPVAITLKDHIASLVLTRVTDWVRWCSPEQTYGSGSPGSPQGAGFGAGRDGGSTGPDGAGGKKRGLDERNPGDSDRGNGDDQDKRRKTEAALTKEEAVKIISNLACPFLKRHPNKKWPRCQRGWASVHRIKEHIYRAHELPIHCDRCFKEFNEEKELRQHNRNADRCDVVDPPCDMLGINEETVKKLRSRAGARNATAEEKWKHMYMIIFPDVPPEDVPSPYYDLQALEIPISQEMRVQYRRFLRQEIPPRVIRQVTENLNKAPEVRDNLHFPERKISEVVTRAVWDAFDHVLPSLLPQSASPATPHDGISELLGAGKTTQQLPTHTPTPLSTQATDTPMPEKLSKASPAVPEMTPFLPSYPDSNSPFNGWSAQTDGSIPSLDAQGLFLDSLTQSKQYVAEPATLSGGSLPFLGQSGGNTLPPTVQLDEDVDRYLDYTQTY
ncbi:hypothetical protein AK830_g912 [Neonectria ditissima]|uniref:C2H2-type domain-containing protein n=1 Tax=Neonectria ditissima TaxID=78410 RepID=A0A0P7BG17_9HYPO|nr:hypothetical protein AK830_g912 [Neonectria ditissima]